MDAIPADVTTGRLYAARHPLVWIRLDGRWREGEAVEWFRTGDGRWAVTVRTAGLVRPYVYSPATIMRREKGQAAPG